MLIVGLNGSPNTDGETVALLEVVLRECRRLGARTELLHVVDALEDQDDPFCSACGSPCPETCHMDTNLAEAQEVLRGADALVVGSPVYFSNMTAQLKAFWDKSRNLRNQRALMGKPAGAVSVGDARFGGQEITVRAIHDALLLHGMLLVGDGSQASGAGHQGVCAQRPATLDHYALERARVLAEGLHEAALKGIQ